MQIAQKQTVLTNVLVTFAKTNAHIVANAPMQIANMTNATSNANANHW
jgi:hypothetical protein